MAKNKNKGGKGARAPPSTRVIVLRAPKPKKKGGRKQKKTGRNPDTSQTGMIKRLLNNPCGEIPRGLGNLTGGGLVRVVRTTITLHKVGAANSGYIVWYPSFHSRGCSNGVAPAGTPTGANIFAYENTGTGFFPSATISIVPSPLWAGVTPDTQTGCTFFDPVYNILGTTFRDAATLAACMKFRYLGSTSDNQGAVGSIEQIDASTLMTNDGTTAFGPSISSLVSYSETRDRPKMEANEVKWAPTNGTGPCFRSGGDIGGANANTVSNSADTLIRVGVGTTGPVTAFTDPSPSSHTGIGFVWNALSANANDIEIELIKVVELRVAPVSGLREAESVVPSAQLYTRATAELDRSNPEWRTTFAEAANYAGNAAMSMLSNAALAGVASYARRGRRLLQ